MTSTRRCSACRERKTIRGIWYVLPPEDIAATAARMPDFVCESCMTRAAAPAAV